MEGLKGSGGIARKLEEGWDYDPAWRNRVVEAYLLEKALIEDPLEALCDEEDRYVRQYYLFRRTGESQDREAFLSSYRCHASNHKTGAASLIKALIVAKVPTKEVAARLRTTTKNVAVFTKLFFDIAPYAKDRDWLASLVFPVGEGAPDLATVRERRWLAAAFLHGREGLGRTLSPKAILSTAERDEMTAEIRTMLTVRAHSFVAGMHNGYAPPTGEDFDRLVKLLDTTARQPVTDDKEGLMQVFMKGIHETLIEKAKRPENADDEVLQSLLPTAVAPDETTSADAGPAP